MPLERKMSFASALLGEGAMFKTVFPKESGAPDFPIHGCMYFDVLPNKDELLQHAWDELVSKEYRFRSLLVATGGGALVWREPDQALDMEAHYFESECADDKKIQAEMEKLVVKPFSDFGKPLWELIAYKNLAGGRSVLVIRLAHVIGDGLGLLSATLPLFRTEKDEPVGLPAMLQNMGKKGSAKRSFFRLLLDFVMTLYYFIYSFFKCLTLPNMPADEMTDLREPTNPYRYTCKRTMVTSNPLDLAICKKFCKASAVTVNDMMVAVLSRGIMSYLYEKGQHVKSLRCLIPISLPRKGPALVNKWSLVSLTLPIDCPSFKHCLAKCQRNLNFLKKLPEPYLNLGLQNFLRLFPSFLRQQAALDLLSKHSIVFTNLPGPTDYMYLCGKRIESISVFVGNLNTQISLISYAGKLRMTIVGDGDNVNCQKLLDHIEDEFTKNCNP